MPPNTTTVWGQNTRKNSLSESSLIKQSILVFPLLIICRHPEDPFSEASETPFEDSHQSEPLSPDATGDGVRQQSPVVKPSVSGSLQGHGGAVRTSKLGAVKASVNFDQLEAQAKEEAKQKSCQSSSHQEPSNQQKAPAADIPRSEASNVVSGAMKKYNPQQSSASNPSLSPEQSSGMERLGMGMKKMTMAQANSASSKESFKTAPPSQGTIKNAGSSSRGDLGVKSISSEQYFKSSNVDEDGTNKERMRNIQGATSVSSNQFFHQDEEEAYPSSSGILNHFQSFFTSERTQGDDADDNVEE